MPLSCPCHSSSVPVNCPAKQGSSYARSLFESSYQGNLHETQILWAFLIIWLILTAYLLFLSNKWASAATPSYAASSAVTTDNFAELLRETLQKNPDLLLSVLRENSEAVLDIAQEGSNQRRHKSLIAQWKAELNQPKEVDIKDRPFRGAADAP